VPERSRIRHALIARYRKSSDFRESLKSERNPTALRQNTCRANGDFFKSGLSRNKIASENGFFLAFLVGIAVAALECVSRRRWPDEIKT
jgi:hypothetical protein